MSMLFLVFVVMMLMIMGVTVIMFMIGLILIVGVYGPFMDGEFHPLDLLPLLPVEVR
jgi:hypothetical protein